MKPSKILIILAETLEHGGATFHVESGEIVKLNEGYAVALNNGVSVGVDSLTVRGITKDEIVEAIVDTADNALSEYVGTWIADGKIYIDPVTILADEHEALALGYAEKQQAIYDFGRKEAIAIEAVLA